jgi:hypothetical protein
VRLADTSAWVWTRAVGSELRAAFDEAVVAGEIATCAIVKLELLYSARNAAELVALRADLDALSDCPIGTEQMQRALDVYELLANLGGLHQRSVRHPDLLIATAAEAAGVPVLHYDEDYDQIAAVTGQPTEWLAPPGTLTPSSSS